MGLSSLPGPWRWEYRANGSWWRVHDALNIEDGPHARPGREVLRIGHARPEYVDRMHLRCALACSAAMRFVLAHETTPLDPSDRDHGARLIDRLEYAMMTLADTPATALRDSMLTVARTWRDQLTAMLREDG